MPGSRHPQVARGNGVTRHGGAGPRPSTDGWSVGRTVGAQGPAAKRTRSIFRLRAIRTERRRLSAVILHCSSDRPGWRNWKTRRTQNPLTLRSCGFESHPGHTSACAKPGEVQIAVRPRRPSPHWLKRGGHRQASVVLDRIVIVRTRHHHRSRSSELTPRNPGRTRACATPEDDELPLVGEFFVDLVDAVFGESVDDLEAAGSQVGVTLSVEAQEYGDESLAD